jgi:hypothetical protein
MVRPFILKDSLSIVHLPFRWIWIVAERVALTYLPVTAMDEQLSSFSLSGLSRSRDCCGLRLMMGRIAASACAEDRPFIPTWNYMHVAFHVFFLSFTEAKMILPRAMPIH